MTGSRPKSRKKLTKKHDAAAEDYPLSWPADAAATG